MRAIAVLLIVGLSFFLVVTYYPDSSAKAAEAAEAQEDQVAPQAELEVLPPVEEETRPVVLNPFIAEPEPALEPEPSSIADPTGEESEDWLSGVALGAGMAPGELAVASALVHGGSGALRTALSRNPEFPGSKALLAEALALTLERKFPAALERAKRIDPNGLSEREQELLKLGLKGEGLGSIAASTTSSPFILSMEMSLCAFGGEEALRLRDYPRAVHAFSSVILAELDSPWPADVETLKSWTQSLHSAQKNYRWNPKGGWPSADMVVREGESPIAVRLRYLAENPGRIMCTGLFLKANGISTDIIQPGQTLRVPTDPTSVLVDLSARWALFLMGNEVVGSWPVGTGRAEHDTPAGEYVAGNKLENPPWMRVGQDPIPFGDERNPLGTRWIGWYRDGVKTSYGLHGTRDPASIGTPSSLGCIRFHNRDVELLYDILPIESPIYVRD